MLKKLPSVLLLILFSTSLFAGQLPIWELEDGGNRIRLMGSVHFLRASDYPLPHGMLTAYEEADALVMEIDMGEFGPEEAQEIITNMGAGRSLLEVMGPDDYAEATKRAAAAGIPLAMLEQFEPWLAAITVTQIRMIQLGFDPSWGIETRLTARAQTDGKPIQGLETIEEQLGFMANMDDRTQSEFLLQSLDDASTLETMVDSIVTSWRSGDTETMMQLMLEGFEEVPELEDALLIKRNRNWISSIKELRNQDQDYLIIVGAMHLVGDNSVVAMLQDEGIKVRQLSTDDLR